MELYNVPCRSYVQVVSDTAPEIADSEILFFDHIDGMYSYCTNKQGDVVHLAAWTEVRIVKGFQ